MKKILIIEDDQIVAQIYRNKLAQEGLQVEVAADGESGLATLRQLHPDVVILDLMLPKLSGVDLLKQVRAQPEFKDLPIVVFSNTYLANMVQEAWKAGATKCLSKASCSPRQFLTVVKSVLNSLAPGSPAAATPVAAAPADGKKTQEQQPAAAPAPDVRAARTEPAVATRSVSRTPEPGPPAPEAPAEEKGSVADTLPATIGTLRMLLQACSKETGPAQLKHLETMYRHAHALTGKAALAGMWDVAHLSDAVEVLVKELHEKPSNLNVSTLRTVASAIDFLGLLVQRGVVTEKAEELVANILVVDDEPISRRAVTHALEKAKLKTISVDNAPLAYELITDNRFDLIFLDVDMPGMNGYELCSKLRALPQHKTTPVIFVTVLSDFEARANSMMSGGNDFIAKPFLFIELAVKALVFILRGRLQKA